MVNLKSYDKKQDFIFHQEEFDNCIQIITKYYDLTDKFVLDLGSGTGLHTGFLISANCKFVMGIDLLDYETLWDGGFKMKLSKLYKDFGVNFNEKKCQFMKMDAENLLFRDNLFDFVFCLNAFEHISNPKKALYEIGRVLKPGGFAFIQFDPVYYCDTGGHMFDFIPEPWGHLVYTEEAYISLLINSGASGNIINDFRYGLNRKMKDYYFNIFEEVTTGDMPLFEKIASYKWSGVVNESHKAHPNFQNLKNIHSEKDLLFRGMNMLLKKRIQDKSKSENRLERAYHLLCSHCNILNR